MQLNNIVYCVCIAEFDILKGNTLSFTVPTTLDINSEYATNIGDLCLPDGSHSYAEDMTYLFLKMTPQQQKHFLGGSATVVEDGCDSVMYGTVLFQNKRDDSVKRGAIQKSLVLFSVVPIFSVWEPLLRVTLSYIMNNCPNDPLPALQTLYNCLTSDGFSKKLSVTLFNETFAIKKPKILPSDRDPFLYMGNVSLLSLVKRFKRDVMFLWYALLCGKRVMIVGTPAKEVANCCMASPLLVHPCSNFSKLIHPYVALTDMDVVLGQKQYICGSTNHLFETRQDWWDVCVSFTTNQVIISKAFKPYAVLHAKDKEFMMNVLGGVEDGRGEAWIRQQFSQFTLKFFLSIQNDKVSTSEHMQLVVNSMMVHTEFYDHFTQFQQMPKEITTTPTQTASELLQKLNILDVDILERVKTVFDLSNLLNDDSAQVEDVLMSNPDVVITVTEWLKDQNSQFRKYAASIMASIASCVRGLLTIVSYSINSNDDKHVLETIVALLTDEMPNVRSRGAYTLYKMSNLFIGCKILLRSEYAIVQKLREIVISSNDDTTTRTNAALTITQLYQFLPDVVSSCLTPDWHYQIHQQISPDNDNQLNDAVFRLLNVILEGEKRLIVPLEYSMFNIPVQHRAQELVAAMKKYYQVNNVYKICLAEFTENPAFPIHIIAAHAVPALMSHMEEWNNNSKGTEYIASVCSQFLTVLSETEMCKSQFMTYDIIDRVVIPALNKWPVSIYCLYVLHLLLSILSKYEDIAAQFIQSGGLSCLMTFILNTYHTPLLSHFTITAVECLKVCITSMSASDQSIVLSLGQGNDDLSQEYETVEQNPLHRNGSVAELRGNLDKLKELCGDKIAPKCLPIPNPVIHTDELTEDDDDEEDEEGEDDDGMDEPCFDDGPEMNVQFWSGTEPQVGAGKQAAQTSSVPLKSSRMVQFFEEIRKCNIEDLLCEKLVETLSALN